jgi:hypothetical protein
MRGLLTCSKSTPTQNRYYWTYNIDSWLSNVCLLASLLLLLRSSLVYVPVHVGKREAEDYTTQDPAPQEDCKEEEEEEEEKEDKEQDYAKKHKTFPLVPTCIVRYRFANQPDRWYQGTYLGRGATDREAIILVQPAQRSAEQIARVVPIRPCLSLGEPHVVAITDPIRFPL